MRPAPAFLSLGGGVQSITMAMMAVHGEISPMPQAAIFADTQWEPSYVYDQVEWLRERVPFPIITVTAGSVRREIVENPDITIPAFMSGGGMLRRQCTGDFKIVPIRREARRLLGLNPIGRPRKGVECSMWIGISEDEKTRQKQSWAKYITNREPLLELSLTREDCKRWMLRRGYPVPRKSSCKGCPFHGDDEWEAMSPEDFNDAVAVDVALRNSDRLVNEDAYLHRSCEPLGSVVFKNAPALTSDECAGVCGI